nr:hypothetical protein [Anaerolineae bacterium]
MEIEAFVQHVIDNERPSFSDLSSESIPQLANRLKEEADRYFRGTPAISLRLADTIIELGKLFNDISITALGTMARGDALRMFHRNDEAWQSLDLAGALYKEVGDPVGWARTRIGRLAICVEMNNVELGLQDAETARDIFRTYNELEKLV